ncbi:hypothetical protein AXG93_1054s1480 [Marchantia polymorpha subsp. ruderalis]|uniref:Uncharacterized protein n=1 Tax=Marchantia polymorpha subsp. ruderalis TaxID=1480154 RepID=A0A176WPX0_MARPO|nr:hypothetical protein AXG93_1054s1480 [Marchantia polymorpha subsp. ruderalis]
MRYGMDTIVTSPGAVSLQENLSSGAVGSIPDWPRRRADELFQVLRLMPDALQTNAELLKAGKTDRPYPGPVIHGSYTTNLEALGARIRFLASGHHCTGTIAPGWDKAFTRRELEASGYGNKAEHPQNVRGPKVCERAGSFETRYGLTDGREASSAVICMH